jgi:hypothetical protein
MQAHKIYRKFTRVNKFNVCRRAVLWVCVLFCGARPRPISRQIGVHAALHRLHMAATAAAIPWMDNMLMVRLERTFDLDSVMVMMAP